MTHVTLGQKEREREEGGDSRLSFHVFWLPSVENGDKARSVFRLL